jgi:hypothetical protein
MLTTHPHLVPMLKKSRAIPPLTPSASMACSGITLPVPILVKFHAAAYINITWRFPLHGLRPSSTHSTDKLLTHVALQTPYWLASYFWIERMLASTAYWKLSVNLLWTKKLRLNKQEYKGGRVHSDSRWAYMHFPKNALSSWCSIIRAMTDRPDDGGSKHLGQLLRDYTTQYPRRQSSSYIDLLADLLDTSISQTNVRIIIIIIIIIREPQCLSRVTGHELDDRDNWIAEPCIFQPRHEKVTQKIRPD